MRLRHLLRRLLGFTEITRRLELVRKPSDQTVNNDTTLQNDDALLAYMRARSDPRAAPVLEMDRDGTVTVRPLHGAPK